MGSGFRGLGLEWAIRTAEVHEGSTLKVTNHYQASALNT